MIPDDANILELTLSPPGETDAERRGRCARWASLALRRLTDTGCTAKDLAIASEGERYWWRSTGFVLAA